MKKFLLSAAILGLAGVAFAEYQIDFDPAMVPGAAAGDLSVEMIVAGVGYEGTTTGPSGFPEMFHTVFSYDALFPFTFINGFRITRMCDSGPVSAEIQTADFSTPYFAGPAQPPAGPTDFGAVLECGGGVVDTEDLPTAFELGNAYPNPFNPATTISFALPQVENVSLNVFNITGQKVATLVNETMARGSYEITFDASALSSGVYMYTLEAGDYSDTKKMVLVK